MNLIDSKYAKSYKEEMERIFPKEEVKALWKNAESIFQDLINDNPNQSELEKKHTYISIFPAIAIYKAIAEISPDKAMEILEKGAERISRRRGEQYAKLVRIPGFKSLFLRLFSKGAKEGFGQDAGFSQEFLSDTAKCIEFNITKCPYNDYCRKYSCREIVHVFCKNDEYAYGNLPGIQFLRTQTLGTDGDCCDFKLKR